VEDVTSLSQGRTAAAQCGLFTHKSVPVIFEPPCTKEVSPHPLPNTQTQQSIKKKKGITLSYENFLTSQTQDLTF